MGIYERLGVILAFTGSLFGAIQGTVKDTSGAVVPGAQVSLLKLPNYSQSSTSDKNGKFMFAPTSPGICMVFASSTGLSGDKTEVECDHNNDLELILRPSAIIERVTVEDRTQLSTSSVASSVSVLTAKDLSSLQISQLHEALRYLTGVQINQTGRRGGVTGMFVRGAGSNYNLITIDGVKINDFGGAYNLSSLPVEQIETINLTRGPQSASYGSYAVGSSLQMETTSGFDHSDLFATTEGGNFGTKRFTAGGGGKVKNFGIYGSFSHLQANGMVRNDDSRFDNVHIKADYILKEKHRLQYGLIMNSNELGNPGAFGRDPAHLFSGLDIKSRTRENYDIHSIRYDNALTATIHERLRASIYSDRLDFEGPYGPSFSRQNRKSLSSETSAVLNRKDILIFGMEWHGEKFKNSFVTDPLFNYALLDRNIFGWFLENHLELTSRLSLNTSVRLEHLRLGNIPADPYGSRPNLPSSTITQLYPKFSGAYRLTTNTRLHSSFGTGFRPPDGFELAFTTNPALKPEQNLSFDSGIEQSFFRRKMAIDVTWFHNRFRNQIITLSQAQRGLSRWRSDNLANSETKGIETTLNLQVMRDLKLYGSYTYLDSAVLSLDRSLNSVQNFFRLGQQLLRRPRHSGSYLAVWQNKRISAETGVIMRGQMLDSEPNFGLSAGQYPNPFYVTFNAGAQFQLRGNAWLTVKMSNILDRTYEESLGFPALGRNFTIGMKWRTSLK